MWRWVASSARRLRREDARTQENESVALLSMQTGVEKDVDSGRSVILLDGAESKAYSNEIEMRNHLQQFPESNNDVGSRIFQYGPKCETRLKLALFEHFPFLQFSMSPNGLTGMSIASGIHTAECTCERCKQGTRCLHRAVECAFSFWRYTDVSEDVDNRLEVTGNSESFTIYAGGQKATFSLQSCSLQCFRFPPRIIEHVDHALDTLLYTTDPLALVLNPVPLDYVLQLVEIMLQNWERIMSECTRFLSFFTVEVLSVRLETDRRIIRHLLGAAQLWRALFELANYQISLLEPIYAFPGDNPWIEDTSDGDALRSRVVHCTTTLSGHRDYISTGLLQETDVLIQRITNLITIDEGYRSRDTNASIRRLSWITFIFLPMIFTSGVFGMNIDILENNPSWKYYIAFLVPVILLVALVYWTFQNDFWLLQRLMQCFRTRATISDVHSEAMLDNSTVLAWAATTGQTNMLAAFLHANRGRAPQGLDGPSANLASAILHGHLETAQLLLEDPSVDILAKAPDGNTALHLAVQAGAITLVQGLLERGVDPEMTNKDDRTALDLAITSKQEKCAATLLLKKYDLQWLGEGPMSSLHYAAIADDTPMYKRLMQNEFPWVEAGTYSATPIFYVAQFGSIDSLREALSLCPNPDTYRYAIDWRGFTLLHHTVNLGMLEAAELLLEKGLSVHQCCAGLLAPPLLVLPDLSYPDGDDPDNLPLVRLLLENGADVDQSDADGHTLAHYLSKKATNNCAAALQYISDKGASFSLQDKEGDTAHHIACAFANMLAMRILVKFPEGLSKRNEQGLSPGETAAFAGHIDLVSLILDEQPSHINLRAVVNDTEIWKAILENAIQKDDWEKVKQTSDMAGVDLKEQRVAFSGAIMQDAVSVTRNLIQAGCPLAWATEREGAFNTTLLQKALEKNCTKTVAVLLDHDVPVDGYDNYGWSALHSAVSAGVTDAIHRIVGRMSTSERDHRDKHGWSALDLAVWNRNEDARHLLDNGLPYVAPWSKRSGIYYPGCNYSTLDGLEEPLELPTRGKR